MSRGRSTQVGPARTNGKWRVTEHENPKTGGQWIRISGPGMKGVDIGVDNLFDLTEILDDMCDYIEDNPGMYPESAPAPNEPKSPSTITDLWAEFNM